MDLCFAVAPVDKTHLPSPIGILSMSAGNAPYIGCLDFMSLLSMAFQSLVQGALIEATLKWPLHNSSHIVPDEYKISEPILKETLPMLYLSSKQLCWVTLFFEATIIFFNPLLLIFDISVCLELAFSGAKCTWMRRALQNLDQSGLTSEDASSLRLLVHLKAAKAASVGQAGL